MSKLKLHPPEIIDINSKSIGIQSSTVNTTGTSNTFIGSTTGYASFAMPKSKYKLLGRDIELDGYKDMHISMLLTHINLHGIIWYIEFKNQYTDSQVPLPDELSKQLEIEIVSYKRDKNISDIISN